MWLPGTQESDYEFVTKEPENCELVQCKQCKSKVFKFTALATDLYPHKSYMCKKCFYSVYGPR